MNNKQIKILIIEDETPIRRFLRAGLISCDYQLIEAECGEEGIRQVATLNPDVVLLDLGLADIDGLEVTKRIREWSAVPIIVISAREQENDKILALDAGANDYLTKPFSMGELLARIRVVLRPTLRQDGEQNAEFNSGPIRINFATRQVFVNQKELHLTPIEYKLLTLLVRNAGKVLTHKQILTNVWGAAYAKETHYLRIYMKQLRHKLEQNPARPEFFITEPGVGYRFISTQAGATY